MIDPADLDARLDAELRQLPPVRAPRTLLPRVLAATAGRQSAPAATGWSTWSLPWRIAVSTAAVAFLAAMSILIAAPPRGVTDAAKTVGDVATIARVVWDVMLQPVATYLVVLGISLALACALAWAALEAALGEAPHR